MPVDVRFTADEPLGREVRLKALFYVVKEAQGLVPSNVCLLVGKGCPELGNDLYFWFWANACLKPVSDDVTVLDNPEMAGSLHPLLAAST